MMDKRGINNLADIRYMIRLFHYAVISDPITGPPFSGKIDLSDVAHFNGICAYWEAALLKTSGYTGNPFAHYAPLTLTQVQFNRWLQLFEQVIDRYFEGETAADAKETAQAMSNLLMFRLSKSK
ncbi:group III truncated hemoglobin [Mucilaginibacter mali]|uniref:Group III truncated hemoglobin n=1 Tax=Mucilaginibacter mali TaxID=2740462 RepID=A0A7D4TSR0_9SPHI|nr:group III truncated hemoglobin [Mucilaginibacter mali]QKJ32954.1 group III truncated hemoglobin [Mucilaginibacter mali]